MLDRIRQGDDSALEELVEQSWSGLLGHLRRLLGSADQAEDAAQEALVRLWEQRDRWKAGSARALLFRIARNVALDQERRRAVRTRALALTRAAPAATAAPPDDVLASNEVERRVHQALSRLPDRRRAVFELVRFGGMSYREVAETLELSPQTVANHMSLALSDLRTELVDLFERPGDGGREARSNDG
ncbi:MAG: sigma-70 family RNA polymerase sigma factor [Gemmatimonadota bacterium]